jgi:hypothetical protein
MVIYLISSKKHASDIPYIDFKLHNNNVIPSWEYLEPCPNRGVVQGDSMLLMKVSKI